MSKDRHPDSATPHFGIEDLPEPWFRDHGMWYSACPERECDTRHLFGLVSTKLVFSGPTYSSAAEQLVARYAHTHGLREH